MRTGAWKTERMKLRRRHVGLLTAVFCGIGILWGTWELGERLELCGGDGYRMLFLQLPLIDTILLPTMLAMLASRLCDAEVKGGTLKLLCTMEEKGRIFDMKLLMGIGYLCLFWAAQAAATVLFAVGMGFEVSLIPAHMLCFAAEILFPSAAVLILQVVLSFFFENQIIPLAAGLVGSFIGLFAWFFPGNPLRAAFPWGYYSLLGFIGYDWDPATRITHFYDMPFDLAMAAVLLLATVAGYAAGKYFFVRKEL
ncbi:MAG: ABC transporter permease [Eubacteriales bacterium]|nr:ABC transporter permease [Eubacteriales bacterium]